MDDLYQKYLESAVHFLSYRMRSEKEIRDNLAKKLAKGQSSSGRKASPDVIDRVIAWLKEQRFVNDEEFARQWIESRARTKQKSLRVLKMELQQKGISREIIEKVTENPETEVGSDFERAKRLAEKKIGKYRHLPRQEIYQKLGGVLARNGFDWDTTKASIDEVLGDRV